MNTPILRTVTATYLASFQAMGGETRETMLSAIRYWRGLKPQKNHGRGNHYERRAIAALYGEQSPDILRRFSPRLAARQSEATYDDTKRPSEEQHL